MARGHGGLIGGLVLSFGSIAGVLFIYEEFKLEFDELCLIVWTILLPAMALFSLVVPALRESAELRLYLVLLVIAPAAAWYFYGQYVTMDEAVLGSLCVSPVVSLVRMLRASLRRQMPAWNRDFWSERLPEVFLLMLVGVLPVAASTEFGVMEIDDSVLLFFCVFSPLAFAIHESPALRVAREALRDNPSIFKRVSLVVALVDALIIFTIAVLAPIVGYYGKLGLDMDEAVMMFPCGLLPVYCVCKVALTRMFSCMWNDVVLGIGDRLSGYGSMKNLAAISPAKNGGSLGRNGTVPDFGKHGKYIETNVEHGSLSAAEEAVRQERRSRHGAGRSPSAPTTPRGVPGGADGQSHWHHRHHHWAGDTAGDKLLIPAHVKDPLAPVQRPERPPKDPRQGGADKDGKRFKHRSHSMAAAGAGAIELPVYELADPDAPEMSSRKHKGHNMDGTRKQSGTRKDSKQDSARGGGGGGVFGLFGKKNVPAEETVTEAENESRWSASSTDSPTKNARKSRSNSFSLSIGRRKDKGGDGGRTAGNGGSLDAPEAAGNAAQVQQLMDRAPLGGKTKGANSEDMYSA